MEGLHSEERRVTKTGEEWKVNESEKWELISRLRKSIGGPPEERMEAAAKEREKKIENLTDNAKSRGPRPVTGKVTRQVATLPLSEKGAATVFTFSKFNFWLDRGRQSGTIFSRSRRPFFTASVFFWQIRPWNRQIGRGLKFGTKRRGLHPIEWRKN